MRRAFFGVRVMVSRFLFHFLLLLPLLCLSKPANAIDAQSPDHSNANQQFAQAADSAGGESEGETFDAGASAQPTGGPSGQDPASLTTRIDRLERQLRQMTGENEELQHKVQVLEEQLRAARQPEPGKNADAGKSETPRPVDVTTKTPETPPAATTGREGKRADAFRPATAPDAPGAPKPLGVTTPSTPLETPPKSVGDAGAAATPRDPGAPLDIAHGRLVGTQPTTGTNDAPQGAALSSSVASGSPQQEYDDAVAALKSGRYEAAELAFAAFLAKNPKSKLVPAAIYNIGESFFQRGRRREAAEKYLEISSKYSQSSQAPDALLRLGQSLAGLGAKEQACAAFNEIGVKYPAAIGRLRESIERESKKLQC